MNGWVSKWVKKNYPVAKSDLCTCFFSRAQRLAKDDGYISMITASSWMFISSFEKFRKQLLAEGSICSMIQQSTHGYAGVTVPTTMFTYACHRMGVIGSYIRLEDFDRPTRTAGGFTGRTLKSSIQFLHSYCILGFR